MWKKGRLICLKMHPVPATAMSLVAVRRQADRCMTGTTCVNAEHLADMLTLLEHMQWHCSQHHRTNAVQIDQAGHALLTVALDNLCNMSKQCPNAEESSVALSGCDDMPATICICLQGS